MWPFTSKRKKITRAFLLACKPLPRFTVWDTLNMSAPQFTDNDGGRFTVVENQRDSLMLRYELGTSTVIYSVSVTPSYVYISRREATGLDQQRFRHTDAMRFLEKLTKLLNAYTPT